MITDRARELSKAAHGDVLEDLQGTTRAQDELMEELRKNCQPTLDEFIELMGDLVYKPESVWQVNWGVRSNN